MSQTCPCGAVSEYNETHDAQFCPTCLVWLEGTCSDRDCEFCRSRPQAPPALPIVLSPEAFDSRQARECLARKIIQDTLKDAAEEPQERA